MYVRDVSGTHRDTYVYTTEMSSSAEAVVSHDTSPETTQGWCEKAMLRAAPCPFGPYSLVVLAYAELPERVRKAGKGVDWVGECTTTFSDCIRTVRQYIWRGRLLRRLDSGGLPDRSSDELRELLLDGLAPAT